MVRLKGQRIRQAETPMYSFNSYVVRLKESLDDEVRNLEMEFQFLCGAIKRTSGESISFGGNLFQFLCGAIKSYSIKKRSTGEIMFQFLCGAIKSLIQHLRQNTSTKFQFLCGAIKSRAKTNVNIIKITVSIPMWCD